jgi:hypothetical protein
MSHRTVEEIEKDLENAMQKYTDLLNELNATKAEISGFSVGETVSEDRITFKLISFHSGCWWGKRLKKDGNPIGRTKAIHFPHKMEGAK